MKFGGNIVFYSSNEVLFSRDFILFVFNSYVSIDVNKFENLLKNYYSINCTKDKIIGCLKESGCYYSQIMNKIYHSKEDYYNDINI